MSITAATIKRRFVQAYDSFSFNLSANQMDDLFQRSTLFYFTKLLKEYGITGQNVEELGTLITSFDFVPASSSLDISSTSTELPDFFGMILLQPTYATSSFSYPCKLANPANNYSPWSSGSVLYPQYNIVGDTIVVDPATVTPTRVTGRYCVSPPVISFQTADLNTPINLTDKNADAIILIALFNEGVAQRDDSFSQMQQQANQINNPLT